MNIRLTYGNVLVEVPEDSDVTKVNGIYIQNQKKDFTIGKVVMFGPGTNIVKLNENHEVNLELKEGDKVLFKSINALDVELEGKSYKLIDKTSIIAIGDM